MESQKQRIAYFDIAKGIMIAYLIIHHIVDYGSKEYGLSGNCLFKIISEVQRPIMLCYFMPAFFLITGFCSNYNDVFRSFFVKQVRTLLFPAFLVTFIYYSYKYPIMIIIDNIIMKGGMYWFLTSLFFAKILYWFMNKHIKNKYVILFFLICLSFIGITIHEYNLIPNIWYVFQLCDLAVFLALGQFFKGKKLSSNFYIFAAVSYILIVGLCYYYNVRIPHFTAGINTTICNWPLHIYLSIIGSLLFLKLCSLIKNQCFFEFLGKNSLIIYMLHMFLIPIFLKVFFPLLQEPSLWESFIVIYSIFLSVLGTLSIVAYFMNKKYLKWMLGRW